MNKLRGCNSDRSLKLPGRETKSLTVMVDSRDEMTLEFVRLFTDNFINGNSQCCKFLERIFSEKEEITFSELCESFRQAENELKKGLTAPYTSDYAYVFKFEAKNNHIMIALDVSPYMYKYDYTTKCLSIQNLEDIMVLLFRLLVARKTQLQHQHRFYLSIYGYSLDCLDLFVIYEMQEVNRQTINELLKEVQLWLQKRYCSMQIQPDSGSYVTRISDHIQKVLDRIHMGKLSHRLLILSNFQQMPESPTIFFPSGWCTFGFILVGQGNFGTEIIDEDRVRQHYPSSEIFKTRHYFTAKFIENCDKADILASTTYKLTQFQTTNYKDRNLLFLYKQDLIQDIFEKVLVFELLVELKIATQRGPSHKRDLLRQYAIPSDRIVRVLKSRYMEGWEPFHCGALAYHSKTYGFKLKIDRFTHLVYAATEGDGRYMVRLSMEKHTNNPCFKKILEYSDNSLVVVKEIEELEQIDMVLTSDFASLKQRSRTLSINSLLDYNSSSEIEILLKPKFRDLWNIFFHVESLLIGVFKVDNKTESLFLSSFSQLIGRRFDFRIYYKEIVEERELEKNHTKNKSYRKIILTLFIKHNQNTIEMKMGFMNMNQSQVDSHIQSLKNKLKATDFGESILREISEVLMGSDLSFGQFNRIEFTYDIKTCSELICKWLERHIMEWRLRQNFYYLDHNLFVKIKNILDIYGMTKQMCIYYCIKRDADFTIKVTLFSSPCFCLIRQANGGMASHKKVLEEYKTYLRSKQQGLCRLLTAYLWIHRQLVINNNTLIICRMIERVSAVHSWSLSYNDFDIELSRLFENIAKGYPSLPINKDSLPKLPTPNRFLMKSNSLIDIGINLVVGGHNYQALLIAPLIPILLELREGSIYYRVIQLPQEEAEKQLELLEHGLQLLQQQIKHKAYLQTYMDKFNHKEGGDWIHNLQETTLDMNEFFFFWNVSIECDINCQYFQFRRAYISFVKESFQRAFIKLLGLIFDLSGDHFFQKPFSPRSIKENHTIYTSQRYIKLISRSANTSCKTILMPWIMVGTEKFPVVNGDLLSCLDNTHFKTKHMHAAQVKLVLSYTTIEGTVLPASINFILNSLQEIFNEFIIDSKRLDPKMLKEEERCMSMVRTVMPTINSLNNMHHSEFKFDLIENKEDLSQRKLAELMQTPLLNKLFSFCPVNEQYLFVHLLYLNSKAEEKGFITFQNRIFEFSEFRKHIIFFIPFWFILEIKEGCVETKFLIAPFNESIQHNHKSIQQKIERYVNSLFELANLNVLIDELNLTNMCPSEPFELYINETTSKALRQKINNNKTSTKTNKKTKMEMRFAGRKGLAKITQGEQQKQEAPMIRQFRLPLLYKESIPLYERFQDGQGIENIAQNQFWNSIEIANLQDTYKTPFQSDTLIFHFSEISVSKAEPEQLINLDMFKKCKNLLVYSVYCANTELKKSELEATFRQNIINSQQSRLVQKMSEFLLRSSDVVNQTELNLIMKSPKHTIKIKLPYFSSYGIYLSYLRQALGYLHSKTARRSKQIHAKLDSRNSSLLTREGELDYSDKKQSGGDYEYKYNENDEMLFLFNFHKNIKSKAHFGECLYLLELFLCEGNHRIDTLNQYFTKQSTFINRKTKLYIYGVDPRDSTHSLELSEIVKRLSLAYQRSPVTIFSPEPRRNTRRDSTDEEIMKPDRQYHNMSLEMDINIFGEAAYDKIKMYLERLVQFTFEDYIVETIIRRLRRSIQFENEAFIITSKHKKSMDEDDMQQLYKENIEALTSLEFFTVSSKSLTLFRHSCSGWDVEHCQLMDLFHSIVREVTNILTNYSLDLSPQYLQHVQMLYYFLNQDRRAVHFGNYWETYSKKIIIDELNSLDESDVVHGQIGILLSEHLIDELSRRSDEAQRAMNTWMAKTKKFADGKFFSNDCFNFKRNFVLKISLNHKGIDFYSYNLDLGINNKIQKLLQSVDAWILEKKCLKDILVGLREKRLSSLSRGGSSSYIKTSTYVELVDDFQEKKDDRRINEMGIKLSLTKLIKKLVSEVMPPIDNGNFYLIKPADMQIIYQRIFDERIDYEELPEPKREFKGVLAKLGFQLLSVLRKKYLSKSVDITSV